MLSLYDYQSDAIAALRAAYGAGCRAPLLVLPTGAGKTITFSYMAQHANAKGLKVLLLAHRRELITQISAALRRFEVQHGIISPAHPATSHPVQVAMAQTLAKRVKLDKSGRFKFDLVIIDEAHHATRDSTWGAILEHNGHAKLLGVTATPCRLDGKGLGVAYDGFFDHLVVGPSAQDLVVRGNLVRPVIYAPEHAPDLTGVKKRGGDYVASDLAKAVDKSVITGDAVAYYRQCCDRQGAIAFTVTVEHSAHVVDEFKRAGYQAAVLSGKTADRERAQMIRDLGNGRLQVLASCNVVSEGTDIPSVSAAILLRPTASYALAMQQIGRALRAAVGKDRAIILDHAGNVYRHGSPLDPVEWSLSGLGKGATKARRKQCGACHAVVLLAAKVCSECGKAFPAAVTDSESMGGKLPDVLDGKLVELSPEQLKTLRRKRYNEDKRAGSVAELVKLGIERQYKYPRQWAKRRFNELQLLAAFRP